MKNIIEPSQNVDYDDVFETIYNDSQKRGLSDDQVWEIWQAGIAAHLTPLHWHEHDPETNSAGVLVCKICHAVL